MADRYRHGRQAATRQPLAELKDRANTSPLGQQRQQWRHKIETSSQPSLPHSESLEPNGTLNVRNSDRATSPGVKRISQITSEEMRDSKRNSATSTTSTTSGRRRKCYIGHWQLGKTIGKGGCSRVRVVRHRYRDQYGAVKIITRSTAESTRAQSLANLIETTKGSASVSPAGFKPIPYGLEREIAVMKLLEHPNIVRLYDVWENRNELYLIMEYVDGGELFHYVDERKGLAEDEAVFIFRQIVSALLYCHRLLICHRDLKPENILLDRRHLTVKLIDFGMAALQPKGRHLSTPCGSPHYAAPEVISTQPYDGTQADVWSCGVILYVMLTGTTPFNYDEQGNIRSLFKDIASAKYFLPRDLSLEAKDLVARIFVADAKQRITMDDVWDHPFLHKFDEHFGFEGEQGTKAFAVGETPKIEEWRVSRIQDIDREILRNMRTLWHSESEQSLIEKLLSNEYNQEKLFYAALLKHREENLENFFTEADSMNYSASDYHHSRPPQDYDAPPLPGRVSRSESKYSIMNDEHLRPSQSFIAPPPSVSSYDPYRASKDPLVNGNGEYLNVIVHRNGTTSTRRASLGRNLRHPHSARIETLKNVHSRKSTGQSSSGLQRSGRSRSSMPRSSMSRHSITSTLLPSSPPVIATMRPSRLHKPGVSFEHIRRMSTTSALNSQLSTNESTPATPGLPGHLRKRQLRLQATARTLASNSPTAPSVPPIKSRKERARELEAPRIRVKKAPQTPGQHMCSEIRKHSAELEKACEEAFFRDSANSSMAARSSTSGNPSPYDTPPSSVIANTTPDLASSKEQSRPLPELPRDTPNSYLTRTLEETRIKLAAYKAREEDNIASSAKFDEVMKMLDTIMPASPSSPGKRASSAPEASKPSDHVGVLPIISEEGGDKRSSKDGGNWHRSVTAPVPKLRKPEDRTIRVVPPTSPGVVAPLNVHKRIPGHELNPETMRQWTHKTSDDSPHRKQATTIDNSGLMSIDEDSALFTTTPNVVRKKRSAWFGRHKRGNDDLSQPRRSPSKISRSALSRMDDRERRQHSALLTSSQPNDNRLGDMSLHFEQSGESPAMLKNPFASSKKGLSKWLGRKGRHKPTDETATEGNTTMLTNQSLDSLFSSASPAPSSNDARPSSGPERSWFARFFNIKPAMQILCFNMRRGRVRQEMAMLFKEWQRHGIRDLQYSRETNTITARVDKQNTLDIKPVTFRVELFIVLERGQPVGMSIARFIQVKGAASGFRQVLDVVDGVMRSRGWLVEDEEQWKALCDVVGGC